LTKNTTNDIVIPGNHVFSSINLKFEIFIVILRPKQIKKSNMKKVRLTATGIAAALFLSVFAISCDNSGEKKEATTDSPKPAVVDTPKPAVVDTPKTAVVDSPKMDKAAVKPIVKP